MVLRIEQFGRVRRVTLADPGHRNVINTALAADFLRELSQAEADPETGAILIDAEGPVFCGGADPAADLPRELFRFGACISKPVVAAVQGVAISAGLALIANVQVAVAAQGSSFGLTDIRDGHLHFETLHAVAHAVGKRRAQELALTGRIFSTPEAVSWGLVHAVTPAFELDDRASAIATGLANANPEAVRAILDASR